MIGVFRIVVVVLVCGGLWVSELEEYVLLRFIAGLLACNGLSASKLEGSGLPALGPDPDLDSGTGEALCVIV